MNLGNEKESKSQVEKLKARANKRLDSISMISRLRKTNLFNVFFVNAMKRRLPRLVYGLVVLVSIIGHVSLVELFYPPKPFEQLEVVEGVIGSVNRAGRSGYKRMTINEKDGSSHLIRARFKKGEEVKVISIVGKDATIFYDIDLHPFMYKYKTLKSIKYNGEYIVIYDYYDRSLKIYNVSKVVFPISVVLVFFLLFLVYMTNRKR